MYDYAARRHHPLQQLQTRDSVCAVQQSKKAS
jgi:hypothetical protein